MFLNPTRRTYISYISIKNQTLTFRTCLDMWSAHSQPFRPDRIVSRIFTADHICLGQYDYYITATS